MALQVLWHCHKPLSSVLFSVAPRYPKYAISVSALSHVRQKPVPRAALQKARMSDARFSVLFFSQGRNHSWALSPSCSELCPFLSAVLQVLWYCHKLLNSFCSLLPPGIQGMLFLISALRWARQKPLSWAAPQKASALMYVPLFSLPSKGKATSRAFPPNHEHCQVEGGADMVAKK